MQPEKKARPQFPPRAGADRFQEQSSGPGGGCPPSARSSPTAGPTKLVDEPPPLGGPAGCLTGSVAPPRRSRNASTAKKPQADLKVRRITHYVRGIRTGYRRRIRQVLRRKLSELGVGRTSGGSIPCNRKTRGILADSIFAVEDELESRNGGQPDHPAVVQMRAARNRVYDDLGWNGTLRLHPRIGGSEDAMSEPATR